MADREDFQRVLITKHDMKSNEMSANLSAYCLVICNSANQEEVALMKIKKSAVREPNGVRAGTRTT